VISKASGDTLAAPVGAMAWSSVRANGLDMARDGELVTFGGRVPDLSNSRYPYAILTTRWTGSGWSEPRAIDSTLAAEGLDGYAMNPTLAADGTIYFDAKLDASGPYVYRVEPTEDGYGIPVRLAGGINDSGVSVGDPYVDPDERFMLVSGQAPSAVGVIDLYLSRRLPDGGWGPAESLASRLGQTEGSFDRFPSISADGLVLFWVRAIGDSFPGDDSAYWWVSTDVLGLESRVSDDTLWGRPLPGNEPQPLGIDLAASGKLHGRLEFTREGGVLYTVFAQRPERVPPIVGGVASARPEGGGLAPPVLRAEWEDLWPSGIALSMDRQLLVMGAHVSDAHARFDYGLFAAHRTPTGWSEPRLIEHTFTADRSAANPTLARDGTLYFSTWANSSVDVPNLYRMEPKGDGYGEATPLTGGINDPDLHVGDPYVDPDERFMLVNVHGPDNVGPADIAISRRLADGGWGPPEGLGARLGQTAEHFDRFPSISPDGRVLFWARAIGSRYPGEHTEYWWVSTDILLERGASF